MSFEVLIYYAGYIIAVVLCRGLGMIFFIPMLLNMGFNLCLDFGVFAGWDIRWVIASHGLLFFVWVLALSGVSNKGTIVAVVAADLFSAFHGIWPQLTSIGGGETFWDTTSTGIIHVWLTSIFVVSVSVIIRGSVLSKIKRGYVELLIIPKQRFVIPIAFWSGAILFPYYLHAYVPEWLYQSRFMIASQGLVWGWVAFELPFYIMYKRLRSNGD